MKIPYLFAILLLVSVMIASCSKSDDNPAGPSNTDDQENNQTAPSIPRPSFNGPGTSASNEVTNQVKKYVNELNEYSLLLSTTFTAVQPSKSGNEWKWTLTHENGATEIFRATRNSDGSFNWDVIKNGKIDNTNYNNWKAIDGNTSKDQNSGLWKVYANNTDTATAQVSWFSSSSVNKGTLIIYQNSVLQWKTEVVNNSNKSGELKYYGEGPTILFSAAWNMDGTGTWKNYVNGVERSTGKF